MTEAAFQKLVEQLARLMGWLCYHTHDSRRSAAGFPDLVLVRERIIFVELKSATGRLSAEQERWIARLQTAGAVVYLWRPTDWREIEATLT
jgi:hypothetical protein